MPWLGPWGRCLHAVGSLGMCSGHKGGGHGERGAAWPVGTVSVCALTLSLSIHVFGVLLLCKWCAIFKVGVVDGRVGCEAWLCVPVSGCPHGEGRGRGRVNPQSSQGQPN